jgi:hypothetical protein
MGIIEENLYRPEARQTEQNRDTINENPSHRLLLSWAIKEHPQNAFLILKKILETQGIQTTIEVQSCRAVQLRSKILDSASLLVRTTDLMLEGSPR